MKKIVMTLAAVLCCAISATVFNACTSEESNPTRYRYEVKAVTPYVGYSDEVRSVLADFNKAVSSGEYIDNERDNDMKSRCESVRQQHSNIQSAYVKFNLYRYTSAVNAADKEDLIATYELGRALTTPYVEYGLLTNEEEAYAALEAKKANLTEQVYNATYKTLTRLVGKHRGSGGMTSAFQYHLNDVLGYYWPETDQRNQTITHICDSIANSHAADTLAVPVTVTLTKTGLIDEKTTNLWERKFNANIQ